MEKLAGLQVPERAEYIRVITAELTRLQNHACLVGFLLQDMGASGTPLMYAFREREKILDLFESLTGARMMCNYMRFGGCRCDLPAGWLEQAAAGGGPSFRGSWTSSSALLTENEILMARTQGVGVLAAGPGRQRQHHRPDAARQRGELRPPQGGRVRDLRPVQLPGAAGRARRRVRPLHDPGAGNARVVEDPAAGLARRFPTGPIMDPKAKLRGFRPKAGEAYGRIEAPKGELGFYLISDGSPNPYRYRVRPPSFINLTMLEDMCLGQHGGRRGDHPRQRGHCAGRGGSVNLANGIHRRC